MPWGPGRSIRDAGPKSPKIQVTPCFGPPLSFFLPHSLLILRVPLHPLLDLGATARVPAPLLLPPEVPDTPLGQACSSTSRLSPAGSEEQAQRTTRWSSVPTPQLYNSQPEMSLPYFE